MARWSLPLVLTLLTASLVSCVSAPPASPPPLTRPEQGGVPSAPPNPQLLRSLTRTDKGEGGVQVELTWAIPEYWEAIGQSNQGAKFGVKQNLVFLVSFNTHSGDLTQYDMRALSFLRTDKGAEIPATGWEATSKDPHHYSGVLRFPLTGPDAPYVEVVIKGLAGVAERTFRWQLPLSGS